ncbi:hypothetical protein BLNAU_3388 [Blattamonas nauphoetae]|uniref:Right handed beta helix domain-containing protein n=1 Tax=Blattamonas nauphoetae TaxID=2049346 RepID=A0ABQ9YCZ8_9EUKA|nr:hypothetical protein BLNAU_3388 [Blattamonas nauphoetae]
MLCSNTTFRWSSTTSEERPSSSQRRPPSLSSDEHLITDTTSEGNKGNNSDTRLIITTDTTFINCIFQHVNYTTEESSTGGSALILSANTTNLTVDNCTFFNCSVNRKSRGSVVGGCILLKGSSSNRLQSTLTVSSCSFADWYPRNSLASEERGGGIGTISTSAPLSIVGSNYTLSGGKTLSSNSGFISIQDLEDISSPLTVSNCRLQGDGNASDYCLYFRACYFGSVKYDVVTSQDPLLFVDCTSPSLPNTSSVIGCTSYRPIRVTSDGTTLTKCPLLTQLEENSSSFLPLSDGWFTETSPLPVQTDVEIVGEGTDCVHVTLDESPRSHTTTLKPTLNEKADAKLTLRSTTLLPTSSSSPLVAMNEDGNLFVKTVVVSAEQDRTKELIGISDGTAHFFHSRFSSITGSSALIVVSGIRSLFLSDMLFLTISRTLTIHVNGLVQSGSCVERKTSGSISITHCTFGVCSSNGRAGMIDIVSNNATRLEMEECEFDQNKAESEMITAEEGDDVILKDFSDEQLSLNFSSMMAIHTFPLHMLSTSKETGSTEISLGPLQTSSTTLACLISQTISSSTLITTTMSTQPSSLILSAMKQYNHSRAFLHLEGMSYLRITQGSGKPIKSIFSSCDGSFLFTNMSNGTLSILNFKSFSAQRGEGAFCCSSNVTIARCDFSSCSAQHNGFLFLELDSVCRLSLEESFWGLALSSQTAGQLRRMTG